MIHDDVSRRARLIRARKRLRISQEEMAALLLTPKSTYQQWEADRYRVPGAAVIAAELLCELELESVPELDGVDSKNEAGMTLSPAKNRLAPEDFANDPRFVVRRSK